MAQTHQIGEQAGFAFVPEGGVAAVARTVDHRVGHRQRLRTRAGISLAALPDYEILEREIPSKSNLTVGCGCN